MCRCDPQILGRSVYFGAGLRALRTHWPYPPAPSGNEIIERDQKKWSQQTERPAETHAYSADANRPALLISTHVIVSENPQQWYWRWHSLPEADAYSADAVWRELNWRGYVFRINPDGSFRIEDVVPGTYDLRVGLEEKLSRDDDAEGPFAGYYSTIKVPPMTEVYTDQPLDLGDLTLDMLGVEGVDASSGN
jgi:hypothetical protein